MNLTGKLTALALTLLSTSALAQEATTTPPDAGKPNILVIFGDDIGQTNLSTYSFGLMGYTTPNIDRIANEGMKFTDYYAEQSCTAVPLHLPDRAGNIAHRPFQGRSARCRCRPAGV